MDAALSSVRPSTKSTLPIVPELDDERDEDSPRKPGRVNAGDDDSDEDYGAGDDDDDDFDTGEVTLFLLSCYYGYWVQVN